LLELTDNRESPFGRAGPPARRRAGWLFSASQPTQTAAVSPDASAHEPAVLVGASQKSSSLVVSRPGIEHAR